MLIKSADDKQVDIDTLNGLLARAGLDAATRRRIETELRRVQAGWRGEREAAYEIEFHYGANPNRMTIHDLRLEVDGRVAQIDHLLIDRLLGIWVCESKHFSEGVAVDEYGEWAGFYNGRPYGIGSLPAKPAARRFRRRSSISAKPAPRSSAAGCCVWAVNGRPGTA